MRLVLDLLLALTALVASTNADSASSVKHQTSRGLIQSSEARHTGRLLRTEAKNDETIDSSDEERAGFADLFKKASTGFKNKTLELFLKRQAAYSYNGAVTKAVAKENIDLDRLHTLLKLTDNKNRWDAKVGNKPGLKLWQKFDEASRQANPTWKSKLPRDPASISL
ncbi:hypothetical protein PHYPSEUDO_006849 [Phytophthora pseudosyringae]|uniref:RxLR effector protein n=1 Tax=Phytophthora pseudosyringae TaxID=221518 RepID=A0A8T1WEV8_9STRA|nr:hypothetical protein PHYPSEUDO_006849 [Phytophthora pseudosyringae]